MGVVDYRPSAATVTPLVVTVGLRRNQHTVPATARGRLLDSSAAPVSGEHVAQLVNVNGAVIEQILSGESDDPVDYDQDQDEWVLLLQGAAELEVSGETLSLEPGDWVLLPRRTPHRVVRTAARTSWLALHLPGDQ